MVRVVTFFRMYIVNILLAIDQSVNVIMFGDPDETISSRAGRVWPNTWWSWLIDHILFWQTNHCHKAIEHEEGKRDLLFPRRTL
jgi:hypothetical protein